MSGNVKQCQIILRLFKFFRRIKNKGDLQKKLLYFINRSFFLYYIMCYGHSL